jgi:hypothetical protein
MRRRINDVRQAVSSRLNAKIVVSGKQEFFSLGRDKASRSHVAVYRLDWPGEHMTQHESRAIYSEKAAGEDKDRHSAIKVWVDDSYLGWLSASRHPNAMTSGVKGIDVLLVLTISLYLLTIYLDLELISNARLYRLTAKNGERFSR